MTITEGPRAHVPLDDPRLRQKSDGWNVPRVPREWYTDPVILALERLAKMEENGQLVDTYRNVIDLKQAVRSVRYWHPPFSHS